MIFLSGLMVVVVMLLVAQWALGISHRTKSKDYNYVQRKPIKWIFFGFVVGFGFLICILNFFGLRELFLWDHLYVEWMELWVISFPKFINNFCYCCQIFILHKLPVLESLERLLVSCGLAPPSGVFVTFLKSESQSTTFPFRRARAYCVLFGHSQSFITTKTCYWLPAFIESYLE